jgi:hypothetical protein
MPAPTGARSRIVLHIDPDRESDRARHVFDSHLARTKWMTEHGYRHLLRGGAFDQSKFSLFNFYEKWIFYTKLCNVSHFWAFLNLWLLR